MNTRTVKEIAKAIERDILSAYEEFQQESSEFSFLEALGFTYDPYRSIECIRKLGTPLALIDTILLEDLLLDTQLLTSLAHEVANNAVRSFHPRIERAIKAKIDEYYPYKDVADGLESAFREKLTTEYLPLLKDMLIEIRYRRILSHLAGDRDREELDDNALGDMYQLRDHLIDRLDGPMELEVAHVIARPELLPVAAFRTVCPVEIRYDTPIKWLKHQDIGLMLLIHYYWKCINFAFHYCKFVHQQFDRYVSEHGQERAIALMNVHHPIAFTLPLTPQRCLIPAEYVDIQYISQLADEITGM